MQDVTAAIDQDRVAVQCQACEFHTFSSESTFKRLRVEPCRPLSERPGTKQIGGIDKTVSSTGSDRNIVVNHNPAPLEHPDLALALAVRNEVDQIQLPQCRLNCGMHADG